LIKVESYKNMHDTNGSGGLQLQPAGKKDYSQRPSTNYNPSRLPRSTVNAVGPLNRNRIFDFGSSDTMKT